MESYSRILLPVIMLVVGIASTIWHYKASRRIVEDWVFSNGYQLMKMNNCIFGGPFWYRTSKYQLVYKFTIIDERGQTRTGWARVGSWFFGTLSDEITVEWEKRSPFM